MNRMIRKLMILATVGSAILWVAGCQNMHNTSSKLAEARWARARAAVMLQLAEQQYRGGQPDKALVTLGKALELDANFARLQVLRGQIMTEKGQNQAALAAFELAISMEPGSGEAHYHCGVQLERAGQFDKALVHYQAAHDLAPTNVSYVVALAESLGQLDRVPDALELIDKTLESQEQSVALRVTAGELAQAQGDYDTASRYFRDAARLATDDTGVLYGLAMSLYHAGRHDEARGYLEQLIRDIREQQPSADAKGVLPDAAIARIEAGQSDVGGRGELLSALGDCYLSAGQPIKASECFTELGRIYPQRPAPWENLAKVSLYQERWQDALAAADKAVALAGNSASARLIRGYALSKLDRPAEAVEALEVAHRLSPGDSLVLCLLSECQRKLGNPAGARQSLLQALQASPGDALVSRMVGELAGAGQIIDPDGPPTVTAASVVAPQ